MTTKQSFRYWLGALLLPLLNAGSQTPTTIVYRLSAAPVPPLAVDSKPRLDLGESGAAEVLFNRIVAVRQQASGRIMVAMRNPPEIRVFEKDGRYVRTIGRKGAGPGEYEDITDVAVRRADSLVVLDSRQRRFTFLGPDGAVASTFIAQPPFSTHPYSEIVQSLGDGTLLIGYGLVTATKPSATPVEVPQIVGRYSVDGTRLDSIGAFFFAENFLQAAPPTMGGFAFWDRAFGRKGTVVAAGNSFFAGDASAMEVRRYSNKGALLDIHRVDVPVNRVTPAMIGQYKVASMARVQERDREVQQKRVDEMPYPAVLPAYHNFMVDGRGRIWLHEYPVPGNVPVVWIVMDPATRDAKRVLMPPRFTPFEITSTEILGVWRDQDDVEHVRVYRIAGT